MKYICFIPLLFLLSKLASQSGINYQGVARNLDGTPIVNKELKLEISINKIDSILFYEKHNTTTNSFGLFNVVIGTGQNIVGSLKTIDWSTDSLFLKVYLDGEEFESQRINSVPVSLYSIKSGESLGWINSNDSTLYTNRRVGIGVEHPSNGLDVKGSLRISNSSLPGLTFTNIDNISYYFELSKNGDFYLFDPALMKYRLHFSKNGRLGIGTSNPEYELDVNGATATSCLVIKGGCDWYELSNSEEELHPGEVVVLDVESGENYVKRSSSAYSHLVVGVVSGAGGINPGIGLSQDGLLDGNVKVAFGGKVKVKVYGKVVPGDLLTSSKISGCAMKAKSKNRSRGSIIGKAISNIDDEGMVLMQIMMQ